MASQSVSDAYDTTKSSSYSYQELRNIGQGLKTQEKYLGQLQEKISYIEGKISERRSATRNGQPKYSDVDTYRKDELDRLKASYDTELNKYYDLRSQLGEQTYGAARSAAPKDYRTDLINSNRNVPPPNPVNSIYDKNRSQVKQVYESDQYGNQRLVRTEYAQRPRGFTGVKFQTVRASVSTPLAARAGGEQSLVPTIKPAANFSTVSGREVYVSPLNASFAPNYNDLSGGSRYAPAPFISTPQRPAAQQRNNLEGFEKRLNSISEQEQAAAKRTEASADIFRIVPGLRGDNIFQTNARAVLAFPGRLISALPEQAVIAGKKIAAVGEGLTYKETRGRTLEEVGGAVPRAGTAVVQSFDPRSKEGIANIALTLFAVKATAGGRVPATTGVKGSIDVTIFGKQKFTAEGSTVSPPIAPRNTVILRYTEGISGARGFLLGQEAKTSLRYNPSGSITKVMEVGDARYVTKQAPNAPRAVLTEYRGGKLVRSSVTNPLDPLGGLQTREVARSPTARTARNLQSDILAQTAKDRRVLEVTQPMGKNKVVRGFLVEESNARALSKARPGSTEQSKTFLEASMTKRPSTKSYDYYENVAVNGGLPEIFTGKLRGRKTDTISNVKVDVVADMSGGKQARRAQLRVGTPEQLLRNERVRTSNRFEKIGEEFNYKISSPQGRVSNTKSQASIDRMIGEQGSISTIGERSTRIRGTLNVRKVGFGERARNVYNRALQGVGLSEQARGKSGRGQAGIDLGVVDNTRYNLRERNLPKTEQIRESPARPSERPLELLTEQRPKVRTQKSYVEELNIGELGTRFPKSMQRTSSMRLVIPVTFTGQRTRTIPQTITKPETGQLPKPKQDTFPLQELKPLEKTKPQTIPALITQPESRQRSISVPDNIFPPNDAFTSIGNIGNARPGFGLPAVPPLFGDARGNLFGGKEVSPGKQRLRYSASLVAQVFKIYGSQRQAVLGSTTGITVRPYVSKKRKR